MQRLPFAASLALVASWAASGQTYTVSTFAGGGVPVNVPGKSAGLYAPYGVAVDRAGNVFFTASNSVLRLDAATGVLTLVAGSGTPGSGGDDGPAVDAQLNQPMEVAVDAAGNVYISDTGNNRVRRVSNGVIATVAGNGTQGFGGDNGPANSAQLHSPAGIAFDSVGNLYVADNGNDRIRKITNGTITTAAGDGTHGFGGDNGPATSAQLKYPGGLAMDPAGNLYIADGGNSRIRKVSNGVITTVAGNGTQGFSGDNGPATSAQFDVPSDVAVDSAGNLYIADLYNNRIRVVSNGVIVTVAGCPLGGFFNDNGLATSAGLSYPHSVAVDSAGRLYIADALNFRIRRVSGGVITTVAGNGIEGFSGDNGPAIAAQLNEPIGTAVDSAGKVYIADVLNNCVRMVSKGTITTAAGSQLQFVLGDNGPAANAWLFDPEGVAVDSTGDLYIADTTHQRIRKVSGGVITTVAGNGTNGYGGDNGPATSAQLYGPLGVAVDSAGNVYIADTLSNRVRMVSNGVITTVAGNGTAGFSGDNGPATSAALNWPTSVAVDSGGNLYIADSGNNRIRKVSKGVITTVAGNGVQGFSGDNGPATGAQLYGPFGVAVDSAGNVYIADTGNNRVRIVSSGLIATIAGSGALGFSGDGGWATNARLSSPRGLAVDSTGNLYVADTGNNLLRLLTPGTAPIISPGAAPVQPGAWVSVYGSNLASGTALWNGGFPMSLGGTSVTVDGKRAFLWYVSPTQINLQVPDDTVAGPVDVSVTTASGTATSTVTLAAYGPSFSLLGDGKHVAAEIATPSGIGAYGGGTYDLVGPSNTFSYNTRPVKAGETLVLYGVGFGPTTPHVPAGQAFSGAAPTTSPVTITIGGVSASVAFSGITEAGLYQFNLTIPPGTGSGDQALAATVNGVQTPPGPVVSVQ